MDNSLIRKFLRNEKDCNPFNDHFNIAELRNKILHSMTLESFKADPLRDILELLPFFNTWFKECYDYQKQHIINANISYTEYFELAITAVNRNYLIISALEKKRIDGKTVIKQDESYSFKIETMNQGMGRVEASNAMEAETSALANMLNYLRYFENTPINIDANLPAVHPMQELMRSLLGTTMCTIIKEEYDSSIWNDGEWQVTKKDGKTIMNVIYKDTLLLTLNKIGLVRLAKNSMSEFFTIANEVRHETPYGKTVLKVAQHKKKEKRVKDVSIENGFIRYKLAKGFGKMESLLDIRNTMDVFIFYSFMENVKLPDLDGLEILDLVSLYSILQELMHRACNIEFNDEVNKIGDLRKFPVRISLKEIEAYLGQRTEFTARQISKFLSLIMFTHGERINFWDKPMIRFGENVYPLYLPLLRPVLLNLIDFWIGEGGFSLDERGKKLEQYLIQVLRVYLSEKRFYHHIPASQEIRSKSGKKEEIDLLLNLKNIILVAEIKCIKYPMEPRDRHNAMKRLTQAAAQAKRKSAFISEHLKELEAQIGDTTGKKVVPLIITNYPVFSSYVIDGIAITDYYLVEGYFSSGKFTDVRLDQRSGQSTVTHEVHYYHNEDEMCDNIEEFLKICEPIEVLKPLFEIVDFKISMDDLEYEIYVTSAQMKG